MVVYQAPRRLLFNEFGNRFQQTDLWNLGIPTFEEYGHWVTRQMFLFTRDLLADPDARLDVLGASLQVYRFDGNLYQALGIRFVLSDVPVDRDDASVIADEISRSGRMKMYLHELKEANTGNWSPPRVIQVHEYASAVAEIKRNLGDLRDTVVAFYGDESSASGQLVKASQGRLQAIKDGYHVTAASAGRSILVLPIQFSHCFRLRGHGAAQAKIFRANVVQTGVVFQRKVDASLTFEFQPWSSRCRQRDAEDINVLALK